MLAIALSRLYLSKSICRASFCTIPANFTPVRDETPLKIACRERFAALQVESPTVAASVRRQRETWVFNLMLISTLSDSDQLLNKNKRIVALCRLVRVNVSDEWKSRPAPLRISGCLFLMSFRPMLLFSLHQNVVDRCCRPFAACEGTLHQYITKKTDTTKSQYTSYS